MDQVLQWGFLTRERFLAAWIVLFAMAGLYLLGFLRLEGVKPDEPLGLGRLLTGMAFLVFALSLLPGMFGGGWASWMPTSRRPRPRPLARPRSALAWMKDHYRGALDRARREGKLVFVNFTGYACANCHWMKANMFPRPEIAAALQRLRPGGAVHRRHRRRLGSQREARTRQVPDRRDSVLRHPGSRRKSDRHLCRRDPRPAEYLAFLQKGAGRSGPRAAGCGASPGERNSTAAPSIPPRSSGKVVVVNFWATWCVPCIQEIPGFNNLNQQLGPKGVVVLGVSMDEDGAAASRHS